jgi:hypothetical protein
MRGGERGAIAEKHGLRHGNQKKATRRPIDIPAITGKLQSVLKLLERRGIVTRVTLPLSSSQGSI